MFSFKHSLLNFLTEDLKSDLALINSSLLASVLLFLYLFDLSFSIFHIRYCTLSLFYCYLVIYMIFQIMVYKRHQVQKQNFQDMYRYAPWSHNYLEVKFTIYIFSGQFCFVFLTFRFIPLILTFKVHTVSIRYGINGDYLT